jgi:hypothetical protein
MQNMSPQADLPDSRIPGAPSVEEWSQHPHLRRKRRRFSRRKTKKVVRIILIVVVHIIFIAFLIYIWTKFAYSSSKAHRLQTDAIAEAIWAGNWPCINTGARSASPSSVNAW